MTTASAPRNPVPILARLPSDLKEQALELAAKSRSPIGTALAVQKILDRNLLFLETLIEGGLQQEHVAILLFELGLTGSEPLSLSTLSKALSRARRRSRAATVELNTAVTPPASSGMTRQFAAPSGTSRQNPAVQGTTRQLKANNGQSSPDPAKSGGNAMRRAGQLQDRRSKNGLQRDPDHVFEPPDAEPRDVGAPTPLVTTDPVEANAREGTLVGLGAGAAFHRQATRPGWSHAATQLIRLSTSRHESDTP